jgi:beta-lactamase class A
MQGEAAYAAELDARLASISRGLTSGALGVSAWDHLSGAGWSCNGNRWFHAASVVKVAVLAAVFDAAAQGRFTLDRRLHVRNRFLSVVDGTPFRVNAGRDADAEVHRAIGRTMRLRDLAQHMIVTSSNLATNLLLDLVGVDAARATMARLGVHGIDIRRGVEDDRAFEAGISNRVTPDGVSGLLRAMIGKTQFDEAACAEMLEIMHDQQFAGMIAPGLPDPVRAIARVAHKTGEISTVTHDVGVVFLPGRPPYVVAILVESAGDVRERIDAGIAASAAVYQCIAAAGEAALR